MPEEKMYANSEQDLSIGYCIKIEVTSEGFRVSDPKPIESEEYSEEAEMVPDLTTALKHVMSVIQENPVQGSESDGFEQSMDEKEQTQER